MSKETTKAYAFLGKHKSGGWQYVAIEPFNVKLEHTFGKVKATPDGLVPELDKVVKKVAEECESKCLKDIAALEKKIEGVLQHALLAAQMSGDKGPIKKAAKEAESLIKKTNDSIKKDSGGLAATVEAQAKKGLGKKYAEAFKDYKVAGNGGGAPLTFLFVEPKIKLKDDNLPAAQGLRRGALDIGKAIVAENKTNSTLGGNIEKTISAYTSALWKDKEFGKTGGLNHDKELWKSHAARGEAAAAALKEYGNFIDGLYDTIEMRQRVNDARTKKLKKEIGSMKDKKKAEKTTKLLADVEATNKKMWLALKELKGFVETKKTYVSLVEPLLTEKGVSTDKGAFEKKWRDARGAKSMDSPRKHILATAKHLKGVAEELDKVMS